MLTKVIGLIRSHIVLCFNVTLATNIQFTTIRYVVLQTQSNIGFNNGSLRMYAVPEVWCTLLVTTYAYNFNYG